ncbi:MAG: hypothetical protein ACLQU4_11830 [Limisphaerales bacterium]
MEEFEFIGPNDEPALLAITSPEALNTAKAVLIELGYKVHVVDTHPQFETRYNQVNYQVVIIEETFAGGNLLENPSLRMVQELTMSQRRYATIFLIGPTFESLNTLQAFTQSVHCVLNFSELSMLKEVVQKTIAENDLFLSTFRDVQRRVYQKGA